jgi:hypothetical protein
MSLEQRYKEVNGVLVPQEIPTMIGFGCEKCDDSELCVTALNGDVAPAPILAFLRRHRGCGLLVTLEKRKDGRLYATGKLDPTKPSQVVGFGR